MKNVKKFNRNRLSRGPFLHSACQGGSSPFLSVMPLPLRLFTAQYNNFISLSGYHHDPSVRHLPIHQPKIFGLIKKSHLYTISEKHKIKAFNGADCS